MFINVNNIRLFYDKQGTGKPLILLHGNEENHFIFDHAVEKLKKYYTVYSIDSRGHGQSDKVKTYFYQDMCEDVKCFIEQLELKDVTIMGSSDGAIVALLLGINYPDYVNNLILAGVNITPDGVIDEVYQDMKKQYLKTKNPLIKLMLDQPNITTKQLHQVKANTLLLAGSDDLIKLSHLQKINRHIKDSKLMIIDGEDHTSYIIHNDKIANIIIKEILS